MNFFVFGSFFQEQEPCMTTHNWKDNEEMQDRKKVYDTLRDISKKQANELQNKLRNEKNETEAEKVFDAINKKYNMYCFFVNNMLIEFLQKGGFALKDVEKAIKDISGIIISKLCDSFNNFYKEIMARFGEVYYNVYFCNFNFFNSQKK